MIGRAIILKTSSLRPVEKLIRKSFLFKPLVHRFIAGDTLDEAMEASEQLLGKGMSVSLDNLGENTRSEAEAMKAKSTYVAMLDRIAVRPGFKRVDPAGYMSGAIEDLNISIKMTQCGLDQGDEFAERNYRDVLRVALDQGNFVRVDMEGSEYTDRTIKMVERVRKDFPNTGTVLQSYLYRTPEDVEWAIENKIRLRLVKGAYLEGPQVAHQDKSKVDGAYVTLSKRLLDAGNFPAIATQDEKIILELNRYVTDRNIDRRRFEYQMLYGIRRDLQESLLKDGYRVRIYIPFGDAWYPYFTRRLAERPANSLFILKSLFKG